MIVKLPTEHYLEFLSLKGGCRGLSVSTLVKMSNCWKSSATARIFMFVFVQIGCNLTLPFMDIHAKLHRLLK